MKTRSNMPLFVVECSDIKALSNSQIDLLRCGDYLVKKDASGEHAYKVSYKKDKVGICLTYCDGSGYIETASYDYTGGKWVFNSLDVYHGDEKLDQNQVDARITSLVQGGTLDNAKPIYCHPIVYEYASVTYKIRIACLVFDNNPEQYTWTTFKAFLNTFSGRIVLTGAVNDIANSRITIATILRVSSTADTFFIYGIDTQGNIIDADTGAVNIGILTPDYFGDAVNKIN